MFSSMCFVVQTVCVCVCAGDQGLDRNNTLMLNRQAWSIGCAAVHTAMVSVSCSVSKHQHACSHVSVNVQLSDGDV